MKPSQAASSLRRIAYWLELRPEVPQSRAPDLRALARILAAMDDDVTTVNPDDVEILKYEVNYGDDRTSGEFELEARTPYGLIHGWGDTGTGDPQSEWVLEDHELESDIEFPDLGVPHANDGQRARSRFEANREEEARRVIAEWLTGVSLVLGPPGAETPGV